MRSHITPNTKKIQKLKCLKSCLPLERAVLSQDAIKHANPKLNTLEI